MIRSLTTAPARMISFPDIVKWKNACTEGEEITNVTRGG